MGVEVETGQYLVVLFIRLKPSVYISPGAETLVVIHGALRSLDESGTAWVDAQMAIIVFFWTTEILAWSPFGPSSFFFFLFLFSFNSLSSLELLVLTL